MYRSFSIYIQIVFNKYINQNSFIYKLLSQKGHLRYNKNKASLKSPFNHENLQVPCYKYEKTCRFIKGLRKLICSISEIKRTFKGPLHRYPIQT